MNAHSTQVQQWWSAAECASIAEELAISGVPRSKRGWINRFSDLEGTEFCRKRVGREGGGGFEYAFDALPDCFRVKLLARHDLTSKAFEKQVVQARDERRIAALSVCLLTAKQRGVMEARLEILDAIDFYRLDRDLTEAKAIEAFLYSPDAFEISDDVLIRANDRKTESRSISKRTLQNWYADRKHSIAKLAPKPTKSQKPVTDEPWWPGFLKFWAMHTKPDAQQALDLYKKSLEDPSEAPSIDQVRRALRKLNNIEKHVGREGVLTLKNRLAYVQRSTENLLPTTIFTADGKTFDAEVAHPVHGKPFKPEITTVEDVATRKVVGFAVSLKENVIAVSEALRKSVVAHGIPAVFLRGSWTRLQKQDFGPRCNWIDGSPWHHKNALAALQFAVSRPH